MPKQTSGLLLEVYSTQVPQDSFDEYIQIRSKEENTATQNKDLNRLSIVDFYGGTYDDVVEDAHQIDLSRAHYRQGNLEASEIYRLYVMLGLSDLKVLMDDVDSNKVVAGSEEYNHRKTAIETWQQNVNSVRFAYRNEQGKLSGFTLVYNTEHPEQWGIQIIQDTLAPLEERTTSVFTQGKLEVRGGNGHNLPVGDLPRALKEAMGSDMTARLISDLVGADGKVSRENVLKLNSRLFSRSNIDNRDKRRDQLLELASIATAVLPKSVELQELFKSWERDAKVDPNFYLLTHFQHRLEDTLNLIEDLINKDNGLGVEQKALAGSKVKLTVFAIKLETDAFYKMDESVRYEQIAYLKTAARIREQQKDLVAPLETSYEELVKEAQGLVPEVEFEAKKTTFDEAVKLARKKLEDNFDNDSSWKVDALVTRVKTERGLITNLYNNSALKLLRDIENEADTTYSDVATALTTLKIGVNENYIKDMIEKVEKFNEEEKRNKDSHAEVEKRKTSIGQYVKNFMEFKAELAKLDQTSLNKQKLFKQGEEVLLEIKNIIMHDSDNLSNMDQMSTVLKTLIATCKDPRKIPQLVALSQTVAGHESPFWKKLGQGLLVFAGLSLVAVGILAAIPTGGTSLLVAISTAIGMDVGLAAGSVIVSSLLAGYGMFKAASQTGLSKSVSEFNTALVNANSIVKEPAKPRRYSDDSGNGASANGSEPVSPTPQFAK